MSTNKTPHLNLHAWEPGDDFSRVEFNENFQKLDTTAKTQAETGAKMQQQLDTRGDCSIYTATYIGAGHEGSKSSIPMPHKPLLFCITGNSYLLIGIGAKGKGTVILDSMGGKIITNVSYLWSNGTLTLEFGSGDPRLQADIAGAEYQMTVLYSK